MRLACPQCDLVIDIPGLSAGQSALCPRCHSKVSQVDVDNNQIVVALCLGALILLLSAIFYPFISFSSYGLSQTITLPDAARILFNYDSDLLGLFIDISIIGLPMLMLMLLIPLHLGFLKLLPPAWGRPLLKFTLALEPWVMSEIFIIGVLVSMVKIMSLAEVGFGHSFWAYIGFVLLFTAALSKVNRHRLWNQISPLQLPDPTLAGKGAMANRLRLCHTCHQITPEPVCPRCHSKTYLRTPYSIQKAAAWLVTSVILYIPANMLPVMYTTSFGKLEPSTLIGGVITLWQAGSYPVATIIFLASIVVPIAKALVLCLLCYLASRSRDHNAKLFTRLYQITEFIGKWSMIDVFVVAVLVALVQLGNLMSVTPGLGTLCFSAMVICQMMAAHAFDPRLLWDSSNGQ